MNQDVFHIGLRITKTGIAVFLCILISKFISAEPFYAVIAAVICMKKTSADSRHTGIERVLGTVFGGAFGMGMLYFFKFLCLETYDMVYDILVSLALMLLIKVLTLLKREDAVSIACVVYLSIMLIPMGAQTIVHYAVWRIAETLLGVVVAIGVNHLLPNHHLRRGR